MPDERPEDEIPQGRVRRATKLSTTVGGQGARVAGTLAAGVARSPDKRAAALEKRHLEAAQQLVQVLGSMKGAAMKLGQLASFMELEFVPEEFRPVYEEALATLRAAAPPMSWKAVKKVLDAEWDEPPESIFEELDEEAAAAASIGQVHRGRLPDGREVAVKIQYPGVAEAVRADLDNAGLIARIAKALAPRTDTSAVAAELRERVMEELDYEHEADMQRRFARAYRGHPFVHVPAPVTSLCRPRVLVSDWVDGAPFEAALERPQADRDRLGEVLYRFYFGSLNRLGLFNADPHPGNYLLLDDGRVAFLDYGSTKTVERGQIDAAVTMLEAAVARDGAGVRDSLAGMGWNPKERLTGERLLASMHALSGWYLVDREVTINGALVRKIVSEAADPRGFIEVGRGVAFPAEQVQYSRLEGGLLAILGRLGATRNWLAISREWWRDAEPATELGVLDQAFWASR